MTDSFGTGWTPARVEALKKLWPEGLSASQIAKQLGGGLTRNAVIGKIHRLGLPGRAKPSTPARLPAPPKPRLVKPAKPAKPAPVEAASGPPPARKVYPSAPLRCVEVDSSPVAFIDRRKDQCAYLLDGHDEPTCCGAPVAKGSYCAGHAKLTASETPLRPLKPDFYASLGNRRVRVYREERVAELGAA